MKSVLLDKPQSIILPKQTSNHATLGERLSLTILFPATVSDCYSMRFQPGTWVFSLSALVSGVQSGLAGLRGCWARPLCVSWMQSGKSSHRTGARSRIIRSRGRAVKAQRAGARAATSLRFTDLAAWVFGLPHSSSKGLASLVSSPCFLYFLFSLLLKIVVNLQRKFPKLLCLVVVLWISQKCM